MNVINFQKSIILSLNSRNKSATENINKIMLKQELEDNDVNDVMNIMDELKIKNKCEEISKNYQLNIEKTIEKLPIETNQKKIFNEIFSVQKKRIYNALLNSSAKEVVNFNNVLKKLIN